MLRESKDYSKHLAIFLTQHVVPDFKSPVDFVRARAFWVIDFFDEVITLLVNMVEISNILEFYHYFLDGLF